MCNGELIKTRFKYSTSYGSKKILKRCRIELIRPIPKGGNRDSVENIGE